MANVRKRTQPNARKDRGKKRKVKEVGEKRDGGSVRKPRRDEEISSEEEEERIGNEGEAFFSEEEEEEVDLETADEKRLRIAKAYLDRTRQAAADAEVPGPSRLCSNFVLLCCVHLVP